MKKLTKTCSRGHVFSISEPCPICLPGRGKARYKDITEYVEGFSDETQVTLQRIRDTIKRVAPDASETLSYGIPTFKLHGKNLVHFAAFSDHFSLFPTSSGVAAFKSELKDLEISKGTIRFPRNRPLPFNLIAKIVKYRVEEVSKQNGNSNRIT